MLGSHSETTETSFSLHPPVCDPTERLQGRLLLTTDIQTVQLTLVPTSVRCNLQQGIEIVLARLHSNTHPMGCEPTGRSLWLPSRGIVEHWNMRCFYTKIENFVWESLKCRSHIPSEGRTMRNPWSTLTCTDPCTHQSYSSTTFEVSAAGSRICHGCNQERH